MVWPKNIRCAPALVSLSILLSPLVGTAGRRFHDFALLRNACDRSELLLTILACKAM